MGYILKQMSPRLVGTAADPQKGADPGQREGVSGRSTARSGL